MQDIPAVLTTGRQLCLPSLNAKSQSYTSKSGFDCRDNVDARFIVSAVGGLGNILEIVFIVDAVIDLNETGGRDRGDRGRRLPIRG